MDELLLGYYHEAAQALEAAGLRGPQRFRFLVEEGAGHHEKAWAWRLTGALEVLLVRLAGGLHFCMPCCLWRRLGEGLRALWVRPVFPRPLW